MPIKAGASLCQFLLIHLGLIRYGYGTHRIPINDSRPSKDHLWGVCETSEIWCSVSG